MSAAAPPAASNVGRPSGREARLLAREEILPMVQRFIVPELTLPEIDSRCDSAAVAKAGGAQRKGDRMLFDPFTFLNGLMRTSPAFYGDGEARRIRREKAVFEALARSTASGAAQSYRIRQTFRVRTERLSGRGALHLSLPVPRLLPGIQEVALIRASPAGLADCYLPEAGLLHDVCLLVNYGGESPELEIELEVRQSPAALLSWRNDRLRGSRTAAGDGARAAVEMWRRTVLEAAPASSSPERLIGALLDGIERTFRFALTGPPREPLSARLINLKSADIHTLSQLAAAVLGDLGFSVRLGAGQALLIDESTKRSVLRYPGSPGYEHRFLQWYHDSSQESGCVDLTYLRRWQFASTPTNTRDDRERALLREVGDPARLLLRRGVYPVDLLVSGRPGPARLVSLDSGLVAQLPLSCVDLEIASERMEADS